MKLKICKIFLASPNDTKKERKAVRDIVNELNVSLCPMLNIHIDLLCWETSTYPGIGEDSQDVINQQMGDDYDIFMGLMWKKFGTKTKSADSGTEEEYNRALANYKKGNGCKTIMFYFSNASLPQDTDFEQFQKVKAFKERISKDGVYYFYYKDTSSLKNDLRRHLSKCLRQLYSVAPVLPDSSEEVGAPTIISDEMNRFLEDVGASFTHPNVDEILLSDIYVTPILIDVKKQNRKVDVEVLSRAVDIEGIRYFISGNEASGKSSLAKYLFSTYYNHDLIPVLLNGMDFNKNVRVDSIVTIVNKKLKQQYSSIGRHLTYSLNKNLDFLLIIDDFEKSAKGNAKFWSLLMHNIESLFKHVIVLSDTQIGLVDISENPPFENYYRYEILQFGSNKRAQLINNWYKLGVNGLEIEDTNSLLRKCDEAKANVNRILGKNYIPSFPFFILGMLQAFEAISVNNTNYSLYGFYYENLINDSLGKAVNNVKDTNFYYSFLTEYCFWMFSTEGASVAVDQEDFKTYYLDYCKRHAIDVKKMPFGKVKGCLIEADIIEDSDHVVKIAQKYIYYFFVAKFISNNVDKDDIKELIRKLIQRAFRNEYASIMMFVTHLSKNEWIVDELVAHANTIFGDVTPSEMGKDLDVINNLITEIPKQIVGIIDIQDEREKQLEFEASIEEEEKQFDQEKLNYQQVGLDDDISEIDIIAKLNLALKTIDLLGEIAKKYWGDLLAEQKYDLVLASYNLGLRSLHLYLDIMDNNREELVSFIKRQVTDRYINERVTTWDADTNKDAVKKVSDGLLFNLAFLASWVFLRRVSTAVGYDKLNLTYEEILSKFKANSYKLIDLSIDLNYSDIDIDRIERYKREMKGNHLCVVMLRELSMYHLNLFEEGYRKRERLFQLFEIEDKKQKEISASVVEKRNK